MEQHLHHARPEPAREDPETDDVLWTEPCRHSQCRQSAHAYDAGELQNAERISQADVRERIRGAQPAEEDRFAVPERMPGAALVRGEDRDFMAERGQFLGEVLCGNSGINGALAVAGKRRGEKRDAHGYEVRWARA